MKVYQFWISVTVTDEEALKKAAEARCIKDGVPLEDWQKVRQGVDSDIRMVLDPGINPPGIAIQDSGVQE